MEKCKKISLFLSCNTSIIIICIAIFTFFFPSTFKWVRGNTQLFILFMIMFTMGLTMTIQEFKKLAENPTDVCIGAVAHYTIMPLLAFSVTKIFHLPDPIALGLILVGCCPSGLASDIMAFLCHGDVPFAVGTTTISTLFSPFLTPILVLYLAGAIVNIPAQAMFITIIETVISPVILGLIINYFYQHNSKFHAVQKMMPGISVIGFAFIVGGVVALQGSNFFVSGLIILGAVILHNCGGYALGYIVGHAVHMNTAKKRTITLEVGMQNAGLATGLAMAHFAAIPEAALVAAVACVWHSISGTLLADYFAKKDAKSTVDNTIIAGQISK